MHPLLRKNLDPPLKVTNCGHKHNEKTHVVKTFIYELDVSYAPTYIFRSNDYINGTIKFKHED